MSKHIQVFPINLFRGFEGESVEADLIECFDTILPFLTAHFTFKSGGAMDAQARLNEAGFTWSDSTTRLLVSILRNAHLFLSGVNLVALRKRAHFGEKPAWGVRQLIDRDIRDWSALFAFRAERGLPLPFASNPSLAGTSEALVRDVLAHLGALDLTLARRIEELVQLRLGLERAGQAIVVRTTPAIAIAAGNGSTGVPGQEGNGRAQVQALNDEERQELEELRAQVSRLEREKIQAQGEAQALGEANLRLAAELEEKDRAIAERDQTIAQLQEEAAALQEQLAKLRKALARTDLQELGFPEIAHLGIDPLPFHLTDDFLRSLENISANGQRSVARVARVLADDVKSARAMKLTPPGPFGLPHLSYFTLVGGGGIYLLWGRALALLQAGRTGDLPEEFRAKVLNRLRGSQEDII